MGREELGSKGKFNFTHNYNVTISRKARTGKIFDCKRAKRASRCSGERF